MKAAPDFSHLDAGTPPVVWAGALAGLAVRDLAAEIESLTRVVGVAAHPGDETLGAGGLVADLHDQGADVHVVVVTAGEASHPHSPSHRPDQLAALRRDELRTAVSTLAPHAAVDLLDVADGQVADHVDRLIGHLVVVVGDGRGTVLLAPWRRDGHPDHEAAGRAAATTAARTGALLVEYPIWFWHWAGPGDVPGAHLRRWPVTSSSRVRKRAAVRAHRTQVEPLSSQVGDEQLLSPEFLRHFDTAHEWFVIQEVGDTALDDLHRDDSDPWDVHQSWYERRKRALTLAALPRERYARALEIGCSVGALTGDLVTRCDTVVGFDSSRHAVAAAREWLGDHADSRHLDAPREWPPGRFDLVVMSEVGYFWSPRDLELVLDRVASSLTEAGTLVLCHWRHRIHGWPLDADAVHRAAARDARLSPVLSRHTETDFELVVHGETAR